jgi:class 3 adenylate cyclase
VVRSGRGPYRFPTNLSRLYEGRQMATQPVTLLFTDLVNSTALLERVGDERAQQVLRAHRQLLREALAGHGGEETKWLGDGLLATFASVAEAVRCAVTMQQGARGRTNGERLGLRIGLHVGEMQADEGDYTGSPVVLARRLCERAVAGQILCGSVVVELLRGRQAFQFAARGALELKGFTEPLPAYEVVYTPDDPGALRRQAPFTGRTAELARVGQRLEEARAGRGGVVLLAGEPGIGKTRTLEELAERARTAGALVLWGRCYEGEAARPWGPFAEALGEFVRTATEETLRGVLGPEAAPLSKLVPALRARVPELPEPVALEPYEERVRLLDTVTQFLLALAARVPTLLVLDDLHWADPGTVALLRHVARFAPRGRLLVLGAYRDVEVDREHPLVEVLGTLPRETSYDQLALAGLDLAAVRTLLESLTDADVPEAWTTTLARETRGNPFFLREVVLHLAEEGALGREGGAWRTVADLDGSGLPETVRQVIERRLGRLSSSAVALLRVAAAFTGSAPFDIARRVAGVAESAALDALDEALAAQLLVATADPQAYDFPHALVRHTLYDALSPARQVRLHREIAEAMEALGGTRADEYAAEIARHYHRSATLPGAERGVPWCLAAAAQAERAAAFTEVTDHLRAAVDLLGPAASERPRLLGRLGVALAGALRFDEAAAIAADAAAQLARTESRHVAADYLADVVTAITYAGNVIHMIHISPLLRQGLEYAGERRDATWALLKSYEITEREFRDPLYQGIHLDTPERHEVAQLLAANRIHEGFTWNFRSWSSRAELMATVRDPELYYEVGDYRRAASSRSQEAADSERLGKLGFAARTWSQASRLHVALGEFAEAGQARRRAVALGRRLPDDPVGFGVNLLVAADDWQLAMDQNWEAAIERIDPGIAQEGVPGWWKFYVPIVKAANARIHARAGQVEPAMWWLRLVLPAIERAPVWTEHYARIACDAAETLWLTSRLDSIEVIERNVREKVIDPDFHYPMMDGRLALARLCALQQRYEEAGNWFAKARAVLDEQGARPVRAIVDYDEALMYARRDRPGDRACALPLLDAALAQFRALGMPGWIRRAETLQASCSVAQAAAPAEATPADAPGPDAPGATLRREGDYWTLVYAGVTGRVKDMKGLRYLIHLLGHPGHEFHVLDLIGEATSTAPAEGALRGAVRASGPLLDAAAKAAYRRRLAELREDAAEAERFNDAGRTERARAEMDALTEQLASAVGLGGRDRSAGSGAERARTTVTHSLRTVIERIARQNPRLGDHLTRRVRTGTFCMYVPDPERPIDWTLGR